MAVLQTLILQAHISIVQTVSWYIYFVKCTYFGLKRNILLKNPNVITQMKRNSCVSWQNAFMLYMYKTTIELEIFFLKYRRQRLLCFKLI